MKCFLSLCLIVKDEEKVLRRCLESVAGIVDEIIVVDTGSTDRTKEIAAEFTSQLYDYQWEKDFSKARNYAASMANGEWIMMLDADEYLDRNSFEAFKSKLKTNLSDKNILTVQIVNFIGEDGQGTSLNYHDRIYKNDGNISYYRSIHEMLKHKNSMERRAVVDLQIFHSGYMASVMAEKQKSKRNLELLKLKKDKEAVDFYFLGNEYASIDQYDKAIECYKKGYQRRKSNSFEWIPKLLVRLTDCLIAVNRIKEAMTIAVSGEEAYPHLVDFKFLKGKIYCVEDKYEEAIKVFEDILLRKDQLEADSTLDYLEYLPHRFLGELYELRLNYQKAVYHYSRTVAINPFDDQAWTRLIRIIAKNSSSDELKQFINQTVMNQKTMTAPRLLKILQEARV
jgi:glycosyltransferase involved in cell wall biosynthesis